MARVPYVNREDMAEADRGLYDDLAAQRGTPVLNLFRALAHTPGHLRRLLPYSTSLRFRGTLDPHLRELAILAVGRLCGAEYEFTHHWNIARRAGLAREKLEALAAFDHAAVFNEPERAVIRYAVEATRDVRVSDATFDALRAHLDTERIVELVQIVAYYNFIVRILEPLRIDLEPGITRLP